MTFLFPFLYVRLSSLVLFFIVLAEFSLPTLCSYHLSKEDMEKRGTLLFFAMYPSLTPIARCFTPQIGPELSRRSSDFLELWKLHLAFGKTGELGGVLYVFKFGILDSVLTNYGSQLLCVNM